MLLTLGALPGCPATITQFDDRALWELASSNLTLLDFTTLSGTYNTFGGLTTAGVNFVGILNQFFPAELAVVSDESWGSGPYLRGPWRNNNPYSRIEISLPAGVTSIGTDIMYQNAAAAAYLVTLSTGGPALTTMSTIGNYNGRAFFGVTSDVPISSIVFFPQDLNFNRAVLDNFAYGTVSTSTPETATLILAGSGLWLLARLRRRRAEDSRRPVIVRESRPC